MFLLLLVTAVLFALLLTRKTICVVRKALRPDLSRFKRKGNVQPEATENSGNDAIHPESAETVEEPELKQPEGSLHILERFTAQFFTIPDTEA